MLAGSAITAKTGLTLNDVEGVVGPVMAAVGASWSLYSGIKARRAAQ